MCGFLFTIIWIWPFGFGAGRSVLICLFYVATMGVVAARRCCCGSSAGVDLQLSREATSGSLARMMLARLWILYGDVLDLGKCAHVQMGMTNFVFDYLRMVYAVTLLRLLERIW